MPAHIYLFFPYTIIILHKNGAFMKKRLISLILCVLFIFSACTFPSEHSDAGKDFNLFTEKLFQSYCTSDSLSLNYTLSQPEKYGITSLPAGFPSFTMADLKQSALVTENQLQTLSSFSKDDLSLEQQILYDALEESLQLEKEGQSFLNFSTSLGPTTGIQAQLPVLLSEFRIENESDLNQYFLLLQTVPDYFSSLLSLEKEKSRKGTLASHQTLTNIIAQCETFLHDNSSKKENALLCTTFRAKLSSLTFLTEQEKSDALNKNNQYVASYVYPAYTSLINGLKELLSYAGTDGSLCRYPDGTSYYLCLLRETTGSSRSLTEIESHIKEKLNSSKQNLTGYAIKDPSLFSSCTDYTTKYRLPGEILDALKSSILKDFPASSDSNYQIKYVDEALEDFLSPAFYLTPPVDDSLNNIIYINGSAKYNASSLFNTLAHEGYPGHLYQTCYMHEKKLPHLRYLLNYEGYTEGWATYAEIYSYKYTGASKDEIGILRNNMIYSLCLYGLCDIGVHAHGWDKKDLLAFIKQYGNYSEETAASLYSAVIDEPASYLKYTVGYLEFDRLKKIFKEKAGTCYTEKLFHTYVLDMGPCSFSLLEKYILPWLAQNGCK